MPTKNKMITTEPRQFAQIGTSNFSGATIIPHAEGQNEYSLVDYGEGEMQVEEIEHITIEDVEQVEELGEEEEYDDDYSQFEYDDIKTEGVNTFTVKAVKNVKQRQQHHNESSESSSFQYDTSFDLDDLKKRGMTNKSESESGHQFACRHCGKRYRWKSTLKRHERVECGGQAPSFGCPYCQYKAKQRGNLSVHMRKHHGDKPQLASNRKK